MKSNVKKHSLLNKSLVVFLLLNMVACSTVKEESVNANSDVAKTKSVEYSNANISKMIEKVVNKVVWNDEKVVDDVLNIKFQNADDAEKFHIGKSSFDKAYNATMIQNPQRLILDLNGQKSLSNKNFFIGGKYVSKIRLGAHPDKTRLVFDINQASNVYYDVKNSDGGLDVLVSNDKDKISSLINGVTNDTENKIISNDNVKDEDSIKLEKIASNEIKLKDANADTKIDSMTQEKVEDIVTKDKQNKKYQISKIYCYEKADKLQVKVGVNSNVDYELNKVSDSEYTLRLKNTILSKEADKPIALPSTYSSLNSIQASKDSNDTIIKFFVNSNTSLNVKNTQSGILVSEGKIDTPNMIADKSVSSDKDTVEVNISDSQNDLINDIALKAEEESKQGIENTEIAENKIIDDSSKATIERVQNTKESVKAQMDLSKIQNNNGDDKNTVEASDNLEGTIEIEDLVDDSEKGLGNEDEKVADVEGLDEEISKLLDPASGYTGKLISLDFQDTDIDNALKIIAEVSNLNIVASDDISGKVSLRLNNVPWDQALDVILKTNGLDKVQEGNVVRIAPVNRLKSEREELKAARQAEENLEPLQLAYRKISYAKAAELQTLVESVLSDRGSVTFDDRSNQIFIKDIKSRIKDAFEIIKKADLRTPQILLETQIIEAERNLLRDLGSEFGFNIIQSNETGNGTGYNFPSDIQVTGSGLGNNFSSFAAGLGETEGSAISLIFDSLDGTKSLSARISGLEQEGKAKVISKPSVVTTNNTPAEIKSVKTVHVRLPEGGTSIATGQGSSASGSSKSATESIDAGITLKVTPQASPDYYVLLDIMGESSHFDTSEVVDGIPALVIRRATSTVLVSSGQTFALGGVYRVEEGNSLNGVPFLKDIPVLGHLFRRSLSDNKDQDLLFFVTPRIVEGSFDDAK